MKNNITMIAAATLRSFSYITALLDENILIEKVFILDDSALLPGQRKIDENGVMSLKLIKICEKNSIKFKLCPSDVNSDVLLNSLIKSNASLVIYSGYGGQILKSKILEIGKKILHIHSGSLPEYRGSTTIYYAILNKDDCGVTAIILDGGIDMGVIVGRAIHQRPVSGMDIDYDLDIQYRKELLVDMITEYVKHDKFRTQKKQSVDSGKSYFIAHPVLRHIAMLSNV